MRAIRRITPTILLGLIFTPLAIRADERTCSPASLHGTYAIQGQGTIVAQIPGFPPPPFPFAETGIISFDGAGGLSGKTTVNFNGVVLQPTFTGSYTVNSDCTATFTIQSSAGFSIHDNVVVISKKKFRSVEPGPIYSHYPHRREAGRLIEVLLQGMGSGSMMRCFA